MKSYINCPKRKGSPMISVEVCAKTCKRKKKCMEFYVFKNPPLIPELGIIKVSTRTGR